MQTVPPAAHARKGHAHDRAPAVPPGGKRPPGRAQPPPLPGAGAVGASTSSRPRAPARPRSSSGRCPNSADPRPARPSWATSRRTTTPSGSGGRGPLSAQITTGSACHLDAGMVARAVDGLDIARRPAAVHRERGQPGLPRLVRPGREAAGRAAFGGRRRGQAAQVPADLQVRPRRAADEDRRRRASSASTGRPRRRTSGGSPPRRGLSSCPRAAERGSSEWYDLLGRPDAEKGDHHGRPLPSTRQSRAPSPTCCCACAAWCRASASGPSSTAWRPASACAAGCATTPRAC